MPTPPRPAQATHPATRFFQFDRLGLDAESLSHSIADRLVYSIGKDAQTATPRDWFQALALVVRDRISEYWMDTTRHYYTTDAKRVYYFSMEFLIGRLLVNGINNLGFEDACREAIATLGLDYDGLREIEPEAGLGNGGLGRLAACFLDSLATLGMPGYGCGIRYEYGMFHQNIDDGQQVEHPDNWLRYGNPWEFPRPEVLYPVKFFGRVVDYVDERGQLHHVWSEAQEVMAMAYDTPIPGYGNQQVNSMRLWSAKATRDFDLGYFNEGNYIKAVEEKDVSENLSKVLYPDDHTIRGRELRLRQQYFFVSASLQDILGRFSRHHDDWHRLPDKVAIQLNDTHPAVAIPELMRLLMDVNGLSWDEAWTISRRTYSYTNHTLLPEALETWPISLFETVLPRHMQIIYEINRRFLEDVRHRYPGDGDRAARLSLIAEGTERRIRMAHLAIVGSHRVNGVAELHTDLMKRTIFAEFHEFFPDRIINVTNGVTPRLWLKQANPGLATLIDQTIGTDWPAHLEKLAALETHADDPAFRAAFRAIKNANKQRLASLIQTRLGITIDPTSLFDVQIKRIHEYKRQFLNLLQVISRYIRIRQHPGSVTVARTVIFAGKAAPGYARAKLIIRLIHDVADVINNDPVTQGLLKVVFVPNYDVSTAQDIIPAADLSEQISTAGMEASGTGNMKLGLNGALTIGTLDGANVEMRSAVGPEHFFLFGLTAEQVGAADRHRSTPAPVGLHDGPWKEPLEMIGSGFFCPHDRDRYRSLLDALLVEGDHYHVLDDLGSYLACQDTVDELYLNPEAWSRSAVLNVARLGGFSSDRSIAHYAREIWDLSPAPVSPASGS